MDRPPPPPLALHGDLLPEEEGDHGDAAHHAQPGGAVHHGRAAEVMVIGGGGHQPPGGQLEPPGLCDQTGDVTPGLEELPGLRAEGGAYGHPGDGGELAQQAGGAVQNQGGGPVHVCFTTYTIQVADNFILMSG